MIRLPYRLLSWALGIWSPTCTAMGEPPYYSFRGALRGRRDAWSPPRWARDELSPAFRLDHISLNDWRAARLWDRETDPHYCDRWWFESCVCKGACGCHWRSRR
jgi:hypothetical protein